MAEVQRGIIERWSGKLLRWIMGYLFVTAIFLFGVVIWKVAQAPRILLAPDGWAFVGQFLLYAIALGAPYLIIRYRDPKSTTLPLRG